MEGNLRRRTRSSAFGFLLLAAVWLLGGGLAQADTNASTDDKSVAVPTGWYTYTNVTTTQINNLLSANSARLTDVEVYDAANGRYTVAMVTNSGSYAVPGWWWYVGVTPAQISSLLSSNGARLIDIEPYSTTNGIRFAVIMVSNSGSAARNWGWLFGVSSTQIGTYLNNSNATANPQRLIDLKSYVENGVKKYTIISVSNTGTDAKSWQYWFNQTGTGVGDKVSSFGGRIVALERQSDGSFNFIQVKNAGTNNTFYWRYYFGLPSLAKTNEVALQFGSRVFDVETYTVSGTRFYNALMIDNANSETRRIRGAFGEALVKGNGLPNGQWGAYLKRLGFTSSISLNGTRRFEPASAIKAVHNLAMMLRIQSGPTTLSTPLTYYLYPSDTQFDSGYNQQKGLTPNACPNPADETTANDVASTVNFGKDNMMSVSDNRTTRAIALFFATDTSSQTARGVSGTAAIESIAVNNAQMTDTFIDQDRIGCGYVNSRRNQTTLADLGKLYERVRNGTLLGTGVHRTEFFQPMNGQAFGTSCNTASPLSCTENDIRQVVAAEGASLGKTSSEISDFIARMDWRFKPGGYGISCDNPFTPCTTGSITISTQAGLLTLPRKSGDFYLTRDYVFGNYVSDLVTCSSATPECHTNLQRDNALRTVRKELFRSIIRENLATF